MNVAITGATGFVGRYLVRHLVGAGHQLRCWHRPGSNRSGFEVIGAPIEWQPGTLGDEAASRELVRGTDAVMHTAVRWEGPRKRGLVPTHMHLRTFFQD